MMIFVMLRTARIILWLLQTQIAQFCLLHLLFFFCFFSNLYSQFVWVIFLQGSYSSSSLAASYGRGTCCFEQDKHLGLSIPLPRGKSGYKRLKPSLTDVLSVTKLNLWRILSTIWYELWRSFCYRGQDNYYSYPFALVAKITTILKWWYARSLYDTSTRSFL